MLSFLNFRFRKFLLFFEWKKMRFQFSALQFGKELLNIKGKTKQEQLRRNVRLSPHEETSEVAVAFENTKSAFYLNGAIHPQEGAMFRGKTLQSCFPVFSRFSAHPDFFIPCRVRGFETLFAKRTTGTILATVIVRGSNKAMLFL